MDPEVEWDLSHVDAWPEDPVYAGPDAVRRFLRDWLEAWDGFEVGIGEIVETAPGTFFNESWQRGSGLDSHVPVEQRFAHIATVRDGLILRFESWTDRDAARAAASSR